MLASLKWLKGNSSCLVGKQALLATFMIALNHFSQVFAYAFARILSDAMLLLRKLFLLSHSFILAKGLLSVILNDIVVT